MIALTPRDDPVPGRLAALDVVLAGQLDRRLGRLRAALTNNALAIRPGALVTTASASASAGSLENAPVWAKAILPTCSRTASMTRWWLWPRQDTAAPPDASM